MSLLRKIPIYLLFGLLFQATDGAGNTAFAHSFSVVILLPAGENDAGNTANVPVAQSYYDGFRLATRERDGHDNEESDGHLGGLDVYITTLNHTENDVSKIAAFRPDIIVIPGVAPGPRELLSEIPGQDFAVLRLPEVTTEHAGQYYNAPSGPDTDAFAKQFQQDYGRSPDNGAGLGYVAARIIDRAIRALGSAADKTAINTLFADM